MSQIGLRVYKSDFIQMELLFFWPETKRVNALRISVTVLPVRVQTQ